MARSRAADKYFARFMVVQPLAALLCALLPNASRPRLTNFGFTPVFQSALKRRAKAGASSLFSSPFLLQPAPFRPSLT